MSQKKKNTNCYNLANSDMSMVITKIAFIIDKAIAHNSEYYTCYKHAWFSNMFLNKIEESLQGITEKA